MVNELIQLFGVDVTASEMIPAATNVTVAGIIGLSIVLAVFVGGILWRRR